MIFFHNGLTLPLTNLETASDIPVYILHSLHITYFSLFYSVLSKYVLHICFYVVKPQYPLKLSVNAISYIKNPLGFYSSWK